MTTSDKSIQKQQLKNKLRLELKRKLLLIPKASLASKSIIILTRLLNNPLFASAGIVLLFASTETEPDIWKIIKNYKTFNKIFYLPSVDSQKFGILDDSQTLVKSQMNIFEPTKLVEINIVKDIDLAIIPGLGFDKTGNRIGHGSGWYDKVLGKINAKKKIGLCFREQIVAEIPTESFDIRMDQVITD